MDKTIAAAALAAALAVAVAAPRAAAAQTLADYDYENLSIGGVGVDYGYARPNRVEPMPVYTLSVDLGFLGPGVRLMPSVSYWTSRLARAELERLADQLNRLDALQIQGVQADQFGTIHWSDVSLGVDAQVVWVAPLGVHTYLGAGAALHAMNGRGDAIDDTFVEDLLDTVTAGVAASAGLEAPVLDRVWLYGEARYAVLSDVRYPMARLGLSFRTGEQRY